MSKALPIGKTLCFTPSVKHLDQGAGLQVNI